MQPDPEQSTELIPLNAIRVETALSRYPVHRLAKRGGGIDIEIREENEAGEVLIRWEVDHGTKHGQGGPLAYKLDTLIINRRIEEATRPIPRVICLGSLKDICRELGLTECGPNTNQIKKSLHQNASAYITAKVRYRLANGSQKDLEAGFSRYSVVFTGEKLSDGRTADAVYLELSDRFMQIINSAQVRPLDYDYLKELPPAPQRLYELLSYEIYAVLKHNRPRAKLAYSEFCTYAPQTRYLDWEQARKQMAKLHRLHKESGYIAKVEFQQTTDGEGRPDWLMIYTPGPKARGEYRTFNRKRDSTIESRPLFRRAKQLEIVSPAPEPEPEPTTVERELITRGVTASTARELVREYPEERIAAQVEHFDWLKEKHPKTLKDNPAGYLVSAIREDYKARKGFVSKAERAKKEQAEREMNRQEAAARRLKDEALDRERTNQARILEHWGSLDKAERARLEAEAMERAEPSLKQGYDNATDRTGRGIFLKLIREAHIRKLLNLPEQPIH